MNFAERIVKIRAYSRTVVAAYLTAYRKLALLRPILYDQDLIEQYENSVAAHGLNLLQITLFLDLVKDAAVFTLDQDERAASLHNVLRLLYPGHRDDATTGRTPGARGRGAGGKKHA
jgi:hypothetical protein